VMDPFGHGETAGLNSAHSSGFDLYSPYHDRSRGWRVLLLAMSHSECCSSEDSRAGDLLAG
jgi:hypothetical protein